MGPVLCINNPFGSIDVMAGVSDGQVVQMIGVEWGFVPDSTVFGCPVCPRNIASKDQLKSCKMKPKQNR